MCKTNSNTGMTLLEIMITAVIFSILIVATLNIMAVAQNMQARTALIDNLRGQAESSLDTVVEYFEDINEETIVSPILDAAAPAQNETLIKFKKVDFVDENGQRQYVKFNSGNDREYSLTWQLAPLELDDDKDNDGNGLIDEHVIVYIEHANPSGPEKETTKIIATNVKENYDDDNDALTPEIPGFSLSYQVDDPANPGKWLVRVSIVLEKENPTMALTESGIRGTTVVHYKTATIALSQ